MKKSFLIKSVVGILLFSVFFLSCEKNSNEECSTCQSAEYSLVKSNLNGMNLEFKQYNSENDDFHYLFNRFNNSDFENIFERMNLNSIVGIDIKNLVGFCMITSKDKNQIFKIKNDDVEGVVLYSVDKSKKMNIRIFSNNKGVFNEQKVSNIEIGYITSNEIVDITDLYFKSKENSSFLVTNSLYKMIDNSSNKLLGAKLSKSLKEKYGNRLPEPPRICGPGCTKNDGMRCAEYNNGNYGCKEDPNGTCPEEDAHQTLVNADNNDYDYVKITYDLYYFRSNYLLVHSGGEKIMNDYYDLGKNLPVSFYTLENCIELFDLLESDVTPLITELAVNYYSSTILIDNNLKNKLTAYLNNIKTYYPNQVDKDKIDNLINKLNLFTNKSNDYITKNLHLY